MPHAETPPTQPESNARPWWGSVLLSCVLFTISYTTNCVQRERQNDEMRRQGREIAEVKAMLMEQQKRRE